MLNGEYFFDFFRGEYKQILPIPLKYGMGRIEEVIVLCYLILPVSVLNCNK